MLSLSLVFGTIDHYVHRNRRAAVLSFFSRKAADEMEPLIYRKANVACELLLRQSRRDGKTDLRTVYLAFFTDVICSHVFNEQMDLLLNECEAKGWREAISALAMLTPTVRQLPWLIPVSIKLPVAFWNLVFPSLGRVVQLHRVRLLAVVYRSEWLTNHRSAIKRRQLLYKDFQRLMKRGRTVSSERKI